MWGIFSLHMLYNSQEMKLLLNGIEPFIGLQWLLCLLKDRRFSVQKVLEFTILIWFGSLVLVLSLSTINVLRKPTQYFPHRPLGLEELCHHFRWHGVQWWWEMIITIMITTGTNPSMSASHLQSCNNKWLLDDVKSLQKNCIIMPYCNYWWESQIHTTTQRHNNSFPQHNITKWIAYHTRNMFHTCQKILPKTTRNSF